MYNSLRALRSNHSCLTSVATDRPADQDYRTQLPVPGGMDILAQLMDGGSAQNTNALHLLYFQHRPHRCMGLCTSQIFRYIMCASRSLKVEVALERHHTLTLSRDDSSAPLLELVFTTGDRLDVRTG